MTQNIWPVTRQSNNNTVTMSGNDVTPVVPSDDDTKTFWNLVKATGAMALLAIVWSIAGIVALIHSIVCIGKTRSIPRIIFGVAIAALFGPFFWFYLFFDKDYCRATMTM